MEWIVTTAPINEVALERLQMGSIRKGSECLRAISGMLGSRPGVEKERVGNIGFQTEHRFARDGLETGHTPVSSPFRRLARLENSSLDGHHDKFRLAVSLCKRPRKRRVQMLDQRSKPRHSEPEQCGCLKGHTDSKRQLIGD